jgi:hypothetical protein
MRQGYGQVPDSPSDAVEAKAMGVPLEAAVAWCEAEFILLTRRS